MSAIYKAQCFRCIRELNIPSIETTYRTGLKRTLSIRETTNTEIVYLESNRCPLSVRFTKQQLSFWISLTKYLQDNPEHPLKRILHTGVTMNIKYVQYYQNIEGACYTPKNCQQMLASTFYDKYVNKIVRSRRRGL